MLRMITLWTQSDVDSLAAFVVAMNTKGIIGGFVAFLTGGGVATVMIRSRN